METGRTYHQCIRAVLILTTLLCLMSVTSRAETTTAFQQGVEYVKLRLYPQAVDTFKSILSQHPTNAQALFQLANVYKLQDELELAIQTFNKILKIANIEDLTTSDRLQGLTHLALSEIYCKQSKLDIAEQHAKAAVQRCPTEADTHYRLGYIYTHQAKFDEAHAAFRHTLARNPDFAEVYEWLGLIALMQHKPQEAVGHYQTAIQKKALRSECLLQPRQSISAPRTYSKSNGTTQVVRADENLLRPDLRDGRCPRRRSHKYDASTEISRDAPCTQAYCGGDCYVSGTDSAESEVYGRI